MTEIVKRLSTLCCGIVAAATIPTLQSTGIAEVPLEWAEVERQIDHHRKLVKNCGPLSAARALTLLGYQIDLDQLMNSCDYVGDEGVRLEDVVRICQTIEPATTTCKIDRKDLGKLPTPCILVVNEQRHCLVLEHSDRKATRIWDPADTSTKSIPIADLKSRWHGEAIIFRPYHASPSLPHVIAVVFGLTFMGLRFAFGRGRQVLASDVLRSVRKSGTMVRQ